MSDLTTSFDGALLKKYDAGGSEDGAATEEMVMRPNGEEEALKILMSLPLS
jgi:hypothetical protein